MRISIILSTAVMLTSAFVMTQSDAPALPASIAIEAPVEHSTKLASTGDALEPAVKEEVTTPESKPAEAVPTPPVVEAQIPVPEQKTETTNPVPEPVTPAVKGNGLLPGESAFAWMDRMQREYGVYAYPGTQFFVAPATPCTFQAQVLGCTEQWMNMDGTPTHTRIRLHLAEAAVGNVYVLFHEIGHTQGIMDECQADIYSRSITGIPGGYYC